LFISARLQNRNSQGQCYANLAYAYSQLGDLMKSKQAFDHALLASPMTKDIKNILKLLMTVEGKLAGILMQKFNNCGD
jgi:hypothetical protein